MWWQMVGTKVQSFKFQNSLERENEKQGEPTVLGPEEGGSVVNNLSREGRHPQSEESEANGSSQEFEDTDVFFVYFHMLCWNSFCPFCLVWEVSSFLPQMSA